MTTRPTAAQFIIVGAVLMALAGMTAWVALMPLGRLNAVVALAIAGMKALLIILFFMHVKYSRKVIWLASGAGAAWLFVMFVLSLSDYLTRGIQHIAGK